MFIYRSIIFPFITILNLLFILIFISQISFFQTSVLLVSPSDIKTSNKIHQNPPNDVFARCLLQTENVFSNLSLQWFLVFGTALMYHRSNNFISDDIDIGIFSHDLLTKNITDNKLTSILNKYDFKLLVRYGQMDDGQGWTLKCPNSKLHLGIFVFYRINFKTTSSKSYEWWTASYNGLCAQMPYQKCRRGFSKITLENFEMYGKVFNVVSKDFLIDQYGSQWIIPHKYNYDQSIRIMTNLIDKY